MASRKGPNYPYLTLTLDQNNPEVTVDRNPIIFNNPGVYDCQPGTCIYGSSTANISETSELYYYCGDNVRVGGDFDNDTSATPTCTIKDSSSIIDQITQFSAFGVGSDVSDVLNVSYNSFYSIQSQFFTHCIHSLPCSRLRAYPKNQTTMMRRCMVTYSLLTMKTASFRLEVHLMILWQTFAWIILATTRQWSSALIWPEWVLSSSE